MSRAVDHLRLLAACVALLVALVPMTFSGGRVQWRGVPARACGIGFTATMLANDEPALAFPQTAGNSGNPLGVFASDFAVSTPVRFTEDLSHLPSPPDPSTLAWYWDFGDGTQATGYVVAHQFARAGTYTVRVRVSSQGQHAAPSDFDSAQITIAAQILDHPPTVQAEASARYVQVGQPVTYTAVNGHAYNGGPLSYTWNFGDATSTTGQRVTHVFHQIGNGFVALIVQDQRGARAYTTVPVTVVTQLPIVRVKASSTQIVAGGTVTFDASGSTAPPDRPDNRIVSYQWDFGDGTQLTTTAPVTRHTFATAGTYTVTIQATDRQDLPGTATLTVTVMPPFVVQLLWWLSLGVILVSLVLLALQAVRWLRRGPQRHGTR